jgi:hypothetical protein
MKKHPFVSNERTLADFVALSKKLANGEHLSARASGKLELSASSAEYVFKKAIELLTFVAPAALDGSESLQSQLEQFQSDLNAIGKHPALPF